MSYIDIFDEAWRILSEVAAEVGPTEAPKMDFPLKVMLGIHHEACARVKGRLPWNCDLVDLERYGPGAIEYLECLARKHSQVNLFAQTIRLMRAFEGYLRTAEPSAQAELTRIVKTAKRRIVLVEGLQEVARPLSDCRQRGLAHRRFAQGCRFGALRDDEDGA